MAAPKHVASDETISSETAINLDQGDPLAEADFHMAYGLYDQAADLIRIAISREPGRRDLKLKLLEVFFVWGNKEQFLTAARELAESRQEAAPGEWEKILIMGKQLAPEDALFSGAGGVRGAAAGGVDLDLEGGQSRVDFDLVGDPVPLEDGAHGLDLDIGSAVGDLDATAESQSGITDRNLALEGTQASTGSTRQMTSRMRQSPAAPRSWKARRSSSRRWRLRAIPRFVRSSRTPCARAAPSTPPSWRSMTSAWTWARWTRSTSRASPRPPPPRPMARRWSPVSMTSRAA